MNNPTLTYFDIVGIVTNIIIIVLSFYTAWMNLVKKRISKFGFDAFLLVIGQILDKRQADKVRQSPELIRRIGLMMLLIAIGGVFTVIPELLEIL